MDKIELQQGLNDVVTAKVQRMIENKRPVVEQTIARLIQERGDAQDYIAPIGIERRRTGAAPVITFAAGEALTMNMPQGQFSLHGHAVGQRRCGFPEAAEEMGVPARYLRELSEGASWQRALAANILNEHSVWCGRTRVLVRSVGSQVRGILSDSYRRLDSEKILTAFLSEAMGHRYAGVRRDHTARADLHSHAPERRGGDLYGRPVLDVGLRRRGRRYARLPAQRGLPERHGARERDETGAPRGPVAGQPPALRTDLPPRYPDHDVRRERLHEESLQQGEHHAEGRRDTGGQRGRG